MLRKFNWRIEKWKNLKCLIHWNIQYVTKIWLLDIQHFKRRLLINLILNHPTKFTVLNISHQNNNSRGIILSVYAWLKTTPHSPIVSEQGDCDYTI